MEHEYESNIKCPYCDCEDLDSWEFDEDSGTQTCGGCDKEFNVERHIEVTYSTTRINCEDNESKHDYKFDGVFKSSRKYEDSTWTDLPESEWTYKRIMMCSSCGDKEYVNITEQEYKTELKLI